MEIRFNLSNYGALYEPGGLADQPYSLLRRMNAAFNVYQAMRSFRQARSKVDFQASHPDEWAIMEQVMLLRQAHGRH